MNEELWNAARDGDVARVTRALENGADVNAKTRYGATALTFAADKGRIEVVKLLIERGADVNAQDSFYQMRALDMAMMNNHSDVALLLLDRGSKGVMNVLMMGIQRKNMPVVAAALASPEITLENVRTALTVAKRDGTPELVALLEKKAASMPAPEAPPAVTVDAATLQSYAGTYRNEASGAALVVTLTGQQLTASLGGQPAVTLVPTSPTSFRIAELSGVTLGFQGRGGLTERVLATQNNQTQSFERVAATPAGSAPATGASAPAAAPPKPDVVPSKPVVRTAARPWPGFRGDNAAGNGDGQGAVAQWNVETGQNVLWKTPVPGIATASPIVWGNKVFVVTAVSSKGDKTFRTGLYGDVAPVEDVSEHTWKIYCLDRASGKVLWEQTAFTGVPKVKRHPKSSQANSTPVTDGTRVIASFGSIGIMAAWDMDGKPLWKADIGVIDNGWFFDPTYQWGHSSSPIIYRDKVILQADQYRNSYIAAFDVKTGKQLWRTERDEISSWGTPTIFRAGNREQIVTNGPKVRSYDPETGKLLWTLGPNSEVTVGTPVVGDDLGVRDRRISSRPAHLCDQAERQRRHHHGEREAGDRIGGVEQRRGHLHSKPHLLRRHSVYVRQQRRAVGVRRQVRRAHLPQSRRRRRLVRRVSDRRGRPSLLRERRRRRDCRARGTHVRGAGQERDEGSDHEHAGDIRRRHRHPHARTRLRHRGEIARTGRP